MSALSLTIKHVTCLLKDGGPDLTPWLVAEVKGSRSPSVVSVS